MQAAPRGTAREDVSAKAVNNLAQASYKIYTFTWKWLNTIPKLALP